jgi:hypothetical protein
MNLYNDFKRLTNNGSQESLARRIVSSYIRAMLWRANTQRILSLPAIMTIALLLAMLGARALNVAHPDNSRPRPRAVIESPIKVVEELLVKAVQAVENSPSADLPMPAGSSVLIPSQITRSTSSTARSTLPSRAPPSPVF